MRRKHASAEELVSFALGLGERESLKATAEHVEDCERCRDRTEGLRQADALARAAARTHPSPQQLAEHSSEIALDARERRHIERHIELCTDCRRELELLATCEAESPEAWEREGNVPGWVGRLRAAAGETPDPQGEGAEKRRQARRLTHGDGAGGRRWVPWALAAALVVALSGMVAVALRTRAPKAKTEQAWLMPTTDESIKIVEGVEGGVGDASETTFRWALRGALCTAAFKARRDGELKHLVAVGFADDPERLGGWVQVYDPSESRSPEKCLLDTVVLVPDELMPYKGDSCWRSEEMFTIPGPDRETEDLLVRGYNDGSFPVVFARFRYVEDVGLQRLGMYFHGGTVGVQEPFSLDGRTFIGIQGKRNITLPEGMPGPYLRVTGLLPADGLLGDKEWQDRVAGGLLEGRRLDTGMETSYAFIAPVPGFPRDIARGQTAHDQERGPHALVDTKLRRFLLDTGGAVLGDVVTDDVAREYGEEMKALVPLFMGGLDNQIVQIPAFTERGEFETWLQEWYDTTYKPAALEWEQLVAPGIEAGLFGKQFEEALDVDMNRIKAADNPP